jgi:hypothetical protein
MFVPVAPARTALLRAAEIELQLLHCAHLEQSLSAVPESTEVDGAEISRIGTVNGDGTVGIRLEVVDLLAARVEGIRRSSIQIFDFRRIAEAVEDRWGTTPM